MFQGSIVPPAPPPKLDAVAAPPPKAVAKEVVPPSMFNIKLKECLTYSGGLGGMIGLGCISPSPAFATMVTTFGLSCIVGKIMLSSR